MWRTVDNALSARARTANVACHSVDNACGQMCTKFLVTTGIESICTPDLVTLFERFFCPNSVENSESVVTVPRSNFVFGICRELQSFHTKCGLTVDSTAVAFVRVVSRAIRVTDVTATHGAAHASNLVWGSHVRPREHSGTIALRRAGEGTRQLSPLAQDRFVAD